MCISSTQRFRMMFTPYDYTRIRYAPYCSMYPDLIEAIVYEKTKKATQKKFNKLLDDYQVRLSQSMLAK